MAALSELPNIGPKLEQQLSQVGIATPDALTEVGSRAAWLRIRSMDESACIHRLMALEGAIQGVRKKDLSDGTKQALRDFYAAHTLRK